MIDYTILYKSQVSKNLPIRPSSPWDLYLSAYTLNERTQRTFNQVHARKKLWLIFPEYHFNDSDIPKDNRFINMSSDEAQYIIDMFSSLASDFTQLSICIDITGFIRPHLAFLVRWLYQNGVTQFDAIYSEPIKYTKREDTIFTGNDIKEIRQIRGFEGKHIRDQSKDVLIINSGYEEHLIYRSAEYKDQATKIQLFGFPPLRADMYQENIIRATKAEEAVGHRTCDPSYSLFAPANDPFITASVIQRKVNELIHRRKISNLYLCPLGTKPQLLGMVLYYICECRENSTSMIYPFCESYNYETSTGISRIWKYTIEFPGTESKRA